MKDEMINIMVSMMPMMKPFMWFAAVIAITGVLLSLSNLALRTRMRNSVIWCARLVFVAAVFFLAAQLAGFILNMPPTINFGDAAKFQFILVSFWQIGLALLIAGIFIRYFGTFRLGKPAHSV